MEIKERVLQWDAYAAKAREAVTEGVVLLRNEKQVLPLAEGTKVSVFGRTQDHYYKSGLGSGGMVNVDKVIDIVTGLRESGSVTVNEELHAVYEAWEAENPLDESFGWGSEPWSQAEMPLADEVAQKAASVSDVAIAIIGRTAGEDRDSFDEPGSYQLTEIEEAMLQTIRAHFDRMVVLLNVGTMIDLSFIEKTQPDAVMYVWQGGMIGGLGVADVLTGKVSPSGKMSDTVARTIKDYPSDKNFGDRFRNFYAEDIYVGYRYFETFAKDRVVYPFGFGLSYTTFSVETKETSYDENTFTAQIAVRVTNTGSVAGKEVVQLYLSAPQGKLGKPLRALADYRKTSLLAPGASEELRFAVDVRSMASYDDSGATGYPYCYVLEEGTYAFFLGTDVRSAAQVLTFVIDETIVTRKLSQEYAPTEAFERMVPKQEADGTFSVAYEAAPLDDGNKVPPATNFYRGDIAGERIKGIKLTDVYEKRATLDSFVYDLSDFDLSCLVCGEGMGSALVTPGTASAFGAVSDELRALDMPAICCADGPSGIRMDCGTKAFSLPTGFLLGCTFNDELVEELYSFTGMELLANHVECLLGPGMNMHRHPLNGRNFEYFSEDPLLTGRMATAFAKGLKKHGVSAVPKHFTANDQETGRRTQNSVVSERALREIYLKGFEILVKSGACDAIMTTYGVVNGIRTTECYDLTTKILREEWGFDGVVMTDWWANISKGPEFCPDDAFYYMVESQNDIFMVSPDADDNEYVTKSMEFLSAGDEKSVRYRANLRRSAASICRFILKSEAMRRLLGTPTPLTVEGRPVDDGMEDLFNLTYIEVHGDYEMDLTDRDVKKGTNVVIPLDVKKVGTYLLSLTASSEASEIAQLPVSLFANGTPIGTLTFNGTGGKEMTLTREIMCFGHTSLYRLYVGANGLKLHTFKLEFLNAEIQRPF